MAGWTPVVAGDLASSAIAVARTVATRLNTPECLERAISEAPRQSAFTNRICWVPHSLSQGHAGLAVLCGYLDACFPEEHWDLKAREHLQFAARAAEAFPELPLGIFSGLSGLGFAAWQLSRGGKRYLRLLNSLDDSTCFRAIAAGQSIRGRQGVSFAEFDAISGLSGVGAYLLCRCDEPRMMTALSSIVEGLVDLLSEGGRLPRWYTPAHLLGDEQTRAYCPHGNLNFGLAHGVPAPLALLSLAHAAGVRVPGLEEAIARTADWLCETRFDDEWGINWPAVLPLVQTDMGNGDRLQALSVRSAPDGPSRCAWCYGSPGIARALWLAGEALDRQDYRELAISAMEGVFRRPIAVRRIDSPTFCHGGYGLLAIALRFSHDMGGSAFFDEIGALVQQLLDSYQPESLLGFRHLETRDNEMDQPGLLEGAPGVALALLASATGAEPTWDRLFLLS
jgi:lantibiotic biosynthesis protein